MELFYDFNGEEIPAMGDGSGLAEAMLGLDGVRVTGVSEANGEVTIEVETTEPRAWCERCGCRAESQDRMWVDVCDLGLFSFKWGEGSEGRGGRHGGDMAHPVFRAIVPGQRSVELSDQSRSTEVARFAEANSPLR